MAAPDYTRANFILSVAHSDQLPADEGIEVALMAAPNAGKSSVLNQLTCNRALARVSKTPGRTSKSTCSSWMTSVDWLICQVMASPKCRWPSKKNGK